MSGLLFLQSRASYRAVGRRVAGPLCIAGASPEDLAFVHARLTPYLPFDPGTANPAATPFVATRRGRVVGFAELVRHPPEHAPYVGFWLFSLSVLDPLSRGLGIGEALANRVLDQARAEGAREVWLVVGASNRPAVDLYRKLGFVPAAVEGIEERLEDEAARTGRRRITMVRRLHD